MFEKVTPAKASVAVAEQIVEAIKKGALPVGSKLPSENDLAEQMGVSRPTVREALSALAAVGLIESRPGSGNFVRNPANSIVREALLILENESSCLEIMEARGLLEPPVAGLAAQKRTDEQITEIESVCVKLKHSARLQDFDEYFKFDKAFHTLLIQATQNGLLATILLPLINTMDQRLYREFTKDFYIKDLQALNELALLHQEIFEAVASGNSERATERMQAHWTRMWKVIQDQAEGKKVV